MAAAFVVLCVTGLVCVRAQHQVHLDNPRQLAEYILREHYIHDPPLIQAAQIVRALCESVPSLEVYCEDPPSYLPGPRYPERTKDREREREGEGKVKRQEYRPAGAYNGGFTPVAYLEALDLPVSMRDDWTGIVGGNSSKGVRDASDEDDSWGFVPKSLNLSDMVRDIDAYVREASKHVRGRRRRDDGGEETDVSCS